ncbi:hypothetical protein WA1_48290 [Scytonema hofmannii PCC 7110]|uniref:Calcium-binding protein n=1 Tax=Scytonema hofmannii PCC 7110 TaxID=128403 RepID=A0A139WY85_9CYAN|nr:hypothetical protein [Scytonema hofmannii]KYC37407.1 hypothetical protein WA1_48290 [Scytonema hofmannii PCC 7110]
MTTEYYTGTSGDDYFNYTGPNNLYAQGLGGNDFIWGNNGRDIIYGNEGNDTLKGYLGDDLLYGGAGDDILNGFGSGVEYDDLYGGEGADTFVLGDASGAFYKGAGNSLGYAAIWDFDWTQGDKIQVFGSANDYTLKSYPNIGDSGVVDIYYKGDRIGLVNNTANVIISQDFIFV